MPASEDPQQQQVVLEVDPQSKDLAIYEIQGLPSSVQFCIDIESIK